MERPDVGSFAASHCYLGAYNATAAAVHFLHIERYAQNYKVQHRPPAQQEVPAIGFIAENSRILSIYAQYRVASDRFALKFPADEVGQ